MKCHKFRGDFEQLKIKKKLSHKSIWSTSHWPKSLSHFQIEKKIFEMFRSIDYLSLWFVVLFGVESFQPNGIKIKRMHAEKNVFEQNIFKCYQF